MPNVPSASKLRRKHRWETSNAKEDTEDCWELREGFELEVEQMAPDGALHSHVEYEAPEMRPAPEAAATYGTEDEGVLPTSEEPERMQAPPPVLQCASCCSSPV